MEELRFPFGKYKGRLLKDMPKNYIDWLKENHVLDRDDLKLIKEKLIKMGLLDETK